MFKRSVALRVFISDDSFFQNTFWFGLGGCCILLIPSIIFSIKLAKYYRRMDTEDVFEEWVQAKNKNKINLFNCKLKYCYFLLLIIQDFFWCSSKWNWRLISFPLSVVSFFFLDAGSPHVLSSSSFCFSCSYPWLVTLWHFSSLHAHPCIPCFSLLWDALDLFTSLRSYFHLCTDFPFTPQCWICLSGFWATLSGIALLFLLSDKPSMPGIVPLVRLSCAHIFLLTCMLRW